MNNQPNQPNQQVFNSANLTKCPTAFTGPNKYGDFDFMIRSGMYNDSLFIFNDNEEEHFTCKKGGGNAVVRQYNKYTCNHTYSAGVPTGIRWKNKDLPNAYNGYKVFDERTKYVIDSAFNEIREILSMYDYKRIFFSADKNGIVGSKLFKVNPDVLKYITDQINNL